MIPMSMSAAQISLLSLTSRVNCLAEASFLEVPKGRCAWAGEGGDRGGRRVHR